MRSPAPRERNDVGKATLDVLAISLHNRTGRLDGRTNGPDMLLLQHTATYGTTGARIRPCAEAKRVGDTCSRGLTRRVHRRERRQCPRMQGRDVVALARTRRFRRSTAKVACRHWTQACGCTDQHIWNRTKCAYPCCRLRGGTSVLSLRDAAAYRHVVARVSAQQTREGWMQGFTCVGHPSAACMRGQAHTASDTRRPGPEMTGSHTLPYAEHTTPTPQAPAQPPCRGGCSPQADTHPLAC